MLVLRVADATISADAGRAVTDDAATVAAAGGGSCCDCW